MDQIKLTWQMDYGTVGCDTDERTPVARAIRQLFADGKPFSNLCMCFFRETSGTLRWLGVFVQSAAGRIIYFPGIRNGFDHIQGHQGATLQWRQAFDFDHMSLEQDRLKWHVTATRSTAHLGSPRTLPLGQDRFLWMGLSIADAQVMRPVMKETSIVFDTPPNDSRRRIEVLHQARDGAQFPMVSLNGNHPIRFDEWFLHFSFIVGPKGFTHYAGGELGLPWGSPYLRSPLPERLAGLPARSHRLKLSEDTDIQITVCALPGKLMMPVTITSPSTRATRPSPQG